MQVRSLDAGKARFKKVLAPHLPPARIVPAVRLNCDSPVRQLSQSGHRGLKRAFVLVSSAVFAFGGMAACSADAIEAPTPRPIEPVVLEKLIDAAATSVAAGSGPVAVGFSTYDGSGQVVHPDVVTFSEPWNGHRLWNAITPYPNSAIQFENPSLYASEDGDSWGVPEGVLNPLSRTTRGYLSDPDMLFNPKSNEMWLYYREVHNVPVRKGVTAHLADHVWLTKSSDAVHWSAPQRVTSDSGRFMVSPSIVRMSDTDWSMYQIDAAREGCSAKATRVVRRQSTDGVTWNRAAAVGLVQPGFVAWHLDVQYVPSRNEYWALVAAYPAARGCTNTSLFLATSTDGITWTTYPTPVLAAGETQQFGAAVYRSTFSYESNGNVTIWYSGARTVRPGAKKRPAVLAWTAAVSHTTSAAIFARVNDKTRTIKLAVAQTPGNAAVMSASNVP